MTGLYAPPEVPHEPAPGPLLAFVFGVAGIVGFSALVGTVTITSVVLTSIIAGRIGTG